MHFKVFCNTRIQRRTGLHIQLLVAEVEVPTFIIGVNTDRSRTENEPEFKLFQMISFFMEALKRCENRLVWLSLQWEQKLYLNIS